MSSDLAAQATTASTSSFVAALIFNSAVFGGEIAAFTFLRPYFKLIYEPRAYSPVGTTPQDPLSHNWLKWPLALYHADYTKIRRVNGMDAYFFVRFIRMLMRMWLPIWLLSWVVLLPVTSVNTSVAGHTGLDIFIFGNVSSDKQSRYWAHLVMAWVFTIWIWYNIQREMRHFVTMRQHHLVDPGHSASAQANTILITGIPKKYLTEQALSDLYSVLPGGVKKVWLNRDLKDMPALFKDQVTACKKLESAETALLKTAIKLHATKLQTEVKQETKASRLSEGERPLTKSHTKTPDVTLAEELVPTSERPTHRLKPFSWLPFGLPLMGEKVDSITWARDEIVRTNTGLRHARKDYLEDILSTEDSEHDTYPPLNSAFVLFNQQIAAHLAAQSLAHHEPYRMAKKYTEVAPDDVIWGNLGLNPYEQRVRQLITLAATIGLIILWAFPVAFVGLLSNIHSLANTYKFLAWLNNIPSSVIGIIQGVLPSVLLSVLMMLLPIVLRLLARFEGIPTRSGLELALMNRFFGFQVIHSFLIVTLSSGLIAALPELAKSPASIPSLLAQKLPQASTFFLTYTILQGLSGTAGGFLQIVPLALYYVKLFLMGSTPRSVFKIKYGARTLNFGTTFPGVTLLLVIATAYMVISPIINGLAWASFALFYYLYKFLFLWVFRQAPSSDTGGLFFPKAIYHVFIGLYVQQVCLAALFFLAQDDKNKPSSLPQAALMVVLIGCTICFHSLIGNSYGPLIHDLPLTLADKTHGLRKDVEVVDTPDVAPAKVEPTLATVSGVATPRTRNFNTDLEAADKRPDSLYPPAPGSINNNDNNNNNNNSMSRNNSSNNITNRWSRAPSRSRSTLDSEGPPESVRAQLAEDAGTPEEEGPTDFNHPATANAPPVIWLPRDDLGLGLAESEEAAMRKRGIQATSEGARMDAKGRVDVSSAPPDEQEFV